MAITPKVFRAEAQACSSSTMVAVITERYQHLCWVVHYNWQNIYMSLLPQEENSSAQSDPPHFLLLDPVKALQHFYVFSSTLIISHSPFPVSVMKSSNTFMILLFSFFPSCMYSRRGKALQKTDFYWCWFYAIILQFSYFSVLMFCSE